MNPTLTGPRRLKARPVQQGILAGMVIVAFVAGLVLATNALRLPEFVPRLSLENPTTYQVEIDVTGADRDGWLSLGAVRRESAKTVYEILDQGDQWRFRFRSGGEDGGELLVSRAQLRANGWRVTIPSEAGDRFRGAGLQASAR